VELSVSAALVGALVIAVVLTALHALAPRIRQLPLVPEAATGSFAGGTAVAYVFLHLLPELAQGNEALGEALDEVLRATPLLELGIFFVALAGFTLFYGLDRLARAAGESAPRSSAGAFWLHLSSFAVYNALITYTMPLRLHTGIAFAVLFSIAMGLHFILTDRTLSEHYPRRFARFGRPALAGALLLGWLTAALVAPTSALLVALLTAFLGGSILLNVFKEELPSGPTSSFPWFFGGLVLYSGLLALTTALAE
jgi:hypothetical protein